MIEKDKALSEINPVSLLGDKEELSERIFSAMDNQIPFSMMEIKDTFPEEEYWPLYRAVQKLEKDKRITFYKRVSKRKYFTKTETNDLPHIFSSDGTGNPISIFLLYPEKAIDPESHLWKQLDKSSVNMVPLLFAHLFVIANQHHLSDEEVLQQWRLVRKELMDARKAMVTAVAWIDAVVDHRSMTGNMEKFRAVFGGKNAPTPEQIQHFMLWLSGPYKNRTPTE